MPLDFCIYSLLSEIESSISIAEFVDGRIHEMLSLVEKVASKSGLPNSSRESNVGGPGSNLLQNAMPKHLRRRAMSYNAKRLPRRLRMVSYFLLSFTGSYMFRSGQEYVYIFI